MGLTYEIVKEDFVWTLAAPTRYIG